MKKIFALLLALTLAASAAGCAETDPPVTSPNATSSTTQPTTAPTEPAVNYSVSAEEALAQRDTVIATAGDATLTNGVLQVYYWTAVYGFLNENGSYIYYYGLDPSQPLEQQTFYDGEGTWQEYFLEEALAIWHRYQALAMMNDEAELEMDPEMQAELDETATLLAQSAEDAGFDSAEAFLVDKMGPGCTLEDYLHYTDLFYRSYNYYQYMYEQIQITDADIEAYFTENEEALEKQGITKETMNYGVRHILISPKGGTKSEDGKTTTYSEEEWEACRAEAQQILDQWSAGEATAESFAALAKEYSTDPGSKDNGGLYEGLDEDTSFVEPFKAWYLDESRQVGDTGLVKSDYGYHIMYMDSAKTIWMDRVREILEYNESTAFINAALEKYEMTTDYDKIALGVVDLSAEES